MNEKAQKLVIIATHAEENPDKATIPFAIASAALAMDVQAKIILQTTAVFLATEGYARHVHSAGFPPLSDMMEAFLEAGGQLMVCSPCLQARQIETDELIPQAQVIAGATVVAESLAADSVLSY